MIDSLALEWPPPQGAKCRAARLKPTKQPKSGYDKTELNQTQAYLLC